MASVEMTCFIARNKCSGKYKDNRRFFDCVADKSISSFAQDGTVWGEQFGEIGENRQQRRIYGCTGSGDATSAGEGVAAAVLTA